MEDIKQLTLIFNIEPKPKQSVKSRVFRNKKGDYIAGHYQPKATKDYVNALRDMAIQQLPEDFKLIETILRVIKLHYIYPIPKVFNKKQVEYIINGGLIYKGTRPDVVDNLQKPLFDALQGTVYKDDSLIIGECNVLKYYGVEPKIELILEYGFKNGI